MAEVFADGIDSGTVRDLAFPRFWTLGGELVQVDLTNVIYISEAKCKVAVAMGVDSRALALMSDDATLVDDDSKLSDFAGREFQAVVVAHELVKVVVRLRMMNRCEICNGCETIVKMDDEHGVRVFTPGHANKPSKDFPFDATFDHSASQREIFDNIAPDVIDQVLEGYNAAFVVYGQCGTGKTHTMIGPHYCPDELRGLLPRSIEYIFRRCDADVANVRYAVSVSYFEVYNDEVIDLLSSSNSRKGLKLKDRLLDGLHIEGLKSIRIHTPEEALSVLEHGAANRVISPTSCSRADSRHSNGIFLINVEQSWFGEDGSRHIHIGNLIMADLAGSERKQRSRYYLQDRAFDNVINALTHGKSPHVPYRDSKLTRVLRHAFGGSCKTVLIANIGPADYNYEETLSTLRYAHRAAQVKNFPRINSGRMFLSENSPLSFLSDTT